VGVVGLMKDRISMIISIIVIAASIGGILLLLLFRQQ
jgi:hypothetical protein